MRLRITLQVTDSPLKTLMTCSINTDRKQEENVYASVSVSPRTRKKKITAANKSVDRSTYLTLWVSRLCWGSHPTTQAIGDPGERKKC